MKECIAFGGRTAASTLYAACAPRRVFVLSENLSSCAVADSPGHLHAIYCNANDLVNQQPTY